jgi:hypothetical protein
MASGGTMQLNFATARELQGVSLSVNPAATTAFTYNPLGACSVNATLTFSLGTKSKRLVVPMVGDPQVN